MADEGIHGDDMVGRITGNHMTRATLYALFWFTEHPTHANICASIDLAGQFMMSNAHLARDESALEALGEARTALIESWMHSRDSAVDAMLADAHGDFDGDRDEIARFTDAWLRSCGDDMCDRVRRCLRDCGYGSAVMPESELDESHDDE